MICERCGKDAPKLFKEDGPNGVMFCMECLKLDILGTIGSVGCRTCGVLLNADGTEMNDEQRGDWLMKYYKAKKNGKYDRTCD